jgi:hypothetical protein
VGEGGVARAVAAGGLMVSEAAVSNGGNPTQSVKTVKATSQLTQVRFSFNLLWIDSIIYFSTPDPDKPPAANRIKSSAKEHQISFIFFFVFLRALCG